MREIEFRAKRTDNDEWVYGYYFQELDFENKPITSSIVRNIITKNPIYKTTEQGVCEIDINTLGQYTGLKDRNGTKIFEGDIVKLTRTHIYAPTTSFHNKDLVSLHKIYWDEEKYAFYQRHFNIESKRFIGGGSLVFNDERADENIIEIVGNIWDTPELLKGEK